MVLVWPNWFGLDHNDLVVTKSLWSSHNQFGKTKTILDRPKLFWSHRRTRHEYLCYDIFCENWNDILWKRIFMKIKKVLQKSFDPPWSHLNAIVKIECIRNFYLTWIDSWWICFNYHLLIRDLMPNLIWWNTTIYWHCTPPRIDLLCMKNWFTQWTIEISWNEESAFVAIEKIKILGAVLELPVKQHCQFSLFTVKMGQMGQMGWIGSAV